MEQDEKIKRYIQIAIIASLIIGASSLFLHIRNTIIGLFDSQQPMQITEKGERLDSSADLRLYDLKGDVKEATSIFINEENGDTIHKYNLRFNSNGIATRNRYDNQKDVDAVTNIRRNSDGSQSEYNNVIKVNDDIHRIKAVYEYNGSGLVDNAHIYINNDTVTRKMVYRDNICTAYNDVIKRSNFIANDTMNFQYTDFDKYGNWTTRKILHKRVKKYLEEGIPTEEYTRNLIEKRIINYYK